MNKLKISRGKYSYILIGIGLLLLPTITRKAILNSELYASFNLIFWLGWIGFLKIDQGRPAYVISQRYAKLLLLDVVIIVFYTIGVINYTNLNHYFELIICTFLPISLVFVEIRLHKCLKELFINLYSFFRLAAVIIVIGGIIDSQTGNMASRFFANWYDIASLKGMVNTSRLVSYYGHSLTTAGILLYFEAMNYLAYKYFNLRPGRYMLGMAISVTGIALTGSKTGTVLSLVFLLITNFANKRLRYLLIGTISIYVAYQMGIFSVVIERILIGIERNDITTGRATDLAYLMTSSEYSIHLFTGNGTVASSFVDGALEYPIIRWALRYGIMTTLLLVAVLFIYPLIKTLRNKQFDLVIVLTTLIVFENTNNGLCTVSDTMLVFCILICVILNLSEYLKSEDYQ